MHSLDLKIPPVAVVMFSAALMWVLGAFIPLVLVTFPGQIAIALVFAIAGIQIAIAGVRAFYDHKTTVNPLQPDSASSLITNGVFKLSRNPIYLGMIFGLVGLAVWLGALTSVFVVPITILYLNRFQIQPEERALKKQFGDEFESYSQRVRRWL